MVVDHESIKSLPISIWTTTKKESVVVERRSNSDKRDDVEHKNQDVWMGIERLASIAIVLIVRAC
jgi:hypothetical protein